MNAAFAINGHTLETERLLLRPFRQSDLQDLYEYASVEGVGEMAGWQHHKTIEETQEILNSFIAEDKTFAIVFKENSKVIGSLGVETYGMEEALTECTDYQGRELGFVLGKDYWGKGITFLAKWLRIFSCGQSFRVCGRFYDYGLFCI